MFWIFKPPLFIFIGILFICFSVQNSYYAYQSIYWPKVKGTVRNVSVEPATANRYKLVVKYHYYFKNASYFGDVRRFSSYFFTESEGESELLKYPVGSNLEISVNPNEPNMSVIESGLYWRNYLGMATGILLVTFGCFLPVLKRNWLTDSNS